MNESERAAMERQNAELRRQLAELEDRIDAVARPLAPEDIAKLEESRTRADGIAKMFGEEAPTPQTGERPEAYRIRVLKGLQRYSPAFADFDLEHADADLLDVAEREIFAAAEQVAQSGTEMEGRLVRQDTVNTVGQRTTNFYGDPAEWMKPFVSGGQVCRVVRPGFGQ